MYVSAYADCRQAYHTSRQAYHTQAYHTSSPAIALSPQPHQQHGGGSISTSFNRTPSEVLKTIVSISQHLHQSIPSEDYVHCKDYNNIDTNMNCISKIWGVGCGLGV